VTRSRDETVTKATPVAPVFGQRLREPCRKRQRNGRAFRRLIGQSGFYRAAGVLSLHRIPESDFPANGFTSSEVRRSRNGIARASRQTGGDQRLFDYCARSGDRCAHPAHRVLSHRHHRQHHLHGRSVRHGFAADWFAPAADSAFDTRSATFICNSRARFIRITLCSRST